MRYYDLSNMTWVEIQEALKTVKLAIIPIGAQEQHGPNLTENCDSILATEYAKGLAKRLFPEAIVTPTVNFGISPHHMAFPGTISLRTETLEMVLKDIITSLNEHGIANVLMYNSHGGNIATLKTVANNLSNELSMNIVTAQTSQATKKVLGKEIESEHYGHACEWETSEALYLAPNIVKKDTLEKAKFKEGRWKQLRGNHILTGYFTFDEISENGCLGDARKASEEFGKRIVETSLDMISKEIKRLIKEN